MRQLTMALLLVAAWAPALASSEVSQSADALEEQVFALRRRGAYADAARLAAELVELRQADTDAKPFEVVDAQWLTRTLARVAGLPREAQREIAEADSLAVVAAGAFGESRYADGLQAAERVLDVRRAHLDAPHPEIAWGLHEIGIMLLGQGDYTGAERYFTEALEQRRRALGEEHPDIARSLHDLAVVRMSQSDYAEADSLLKDCLVLRRRLLGDEHEDTLTAMGNLATVMQNLGAYDESEALYRESLGIWLDLAGREDVHVAALLNNLALVLRHKGDYAAAEPLLREALAIRRRLLGEVHVDVANSLNNIGHLLESRGDLAPAEDYFRETLQVLEEVVGDRHPYVALTRSNLAATLHRRGKLDEAERHFRASLALLNEHFDGPHRYIHQTLHGLGGVLRDMGEYALSEELYREAMGVAEGVYGTNHPTYATSLNNLGFVLKRAGRLAEAEEHFAEALRIRRRLLGNRHPSVVKVLRNLAAAHAMRGDYGSAAGLFREAAEIHNEARLRAGGGLGRTTFTTAPQAELASVLLLLREEEDAWVAAEEALARSLLDLLTTAGRGLSPAEVSKEDSLKAILGQLERQVSAYAQAAQSDTSAGTMSRVDEARGALLAAEAEWSLFQQEVARAHPVTEGRVFSLERVQSVLAAGTAIIGWLDVEIGQGGYESWCYAIRGSGPVTWARAQCAPGDSSGSSPFERTRARRSSFAAPGPWNIGTAGQSRALWRERFEPLLPALENVSELVVVPSGAMVGVPVEVFVDRGGAFIGDVYAVSYAPSATIYTWLTEQPRGEVGSQVLLVGDPPYNRAHLTAMQEGGVALLASTGVPPDPEVLRDALEGRREAIQSLPRLTGARSEVSAIAQISPGSTVLIGSEAAEQSLVKLAESARMSEFGTIHVATHALVDDERPERSALIMSQVNLPDPLEAAMAGARICDGLVTAKEILREWTLSADIVTLSACETGLGRKVAGEGYVGFAQAFLQAGARSVLVSLWKVDDTATSLLMRRFYENRLGRYDDPRGQGAGEAMSKARALQEAKRWLREYTDEYGNRPYEHPYFWSAFILIGDRS
jgi:CHAT domain-containing protein/Tfp pilus assembly protein PilF